MDAVKLHLGGLNGFFFLGVARSAISLITLCLEIANRGVSLFDKVCSHQTADLEKNDSILQVVGIIRKSEKVSNENKKKRNALNSNGNCSIIFLFK